MSSEFARRWRLRPPKAPSRRRRAVAGAEKSGTTRGRFRITCINKSGGNHADPHHAIERLGWINEETRKTGINTRLEMYDWIKNQGGQAYVRDTGGHTATVGAREHGNGARYLQTYADGIWTDNLLALPEC